MRLLALAMSHLGWMLLIVVPSLAGAHDCWLQADDYHVPVGAKLVVHLNMGEALKAEEERPYEKEHTERFELRLPNDTRDLMGAASDGVKPVFADVLPAAGAFLVTMVRGSPIVELDPAKFDCGTRPRRHRPGARASGGARAIVVLPQVAGSLG